MPRVLFLLLAAWSLAAPYWRSQERWRAWGLLIVIILLNLVLVGIAVLLTFWQRAFYNTLGDKDWGSFIALLLWWRYTPANGFTPSFALIAAVYVPVTAYALYLRQALQIRWRRWLTERYTAAWLGDRAYYRIALTNPETDNPDQRIAEDARMFVDSALVLGLGLIRSVVSLFSFVVVLWSLSEPLTPIGIRIPGYLVWAALIYAVLGTCLTHLFGVRLISLNFIQQNVEANFRFSLVRIRENAESIAFYKGEPEENRELSRHFNAIVENWRAIMTVTKNLTFFTTGFGQVALIFPFVVVAPVYFAGRMSLGGVFQTSNAFIQVQGALSWIVDNYSTLTSWFATVERLDGFARTVEAARASSEGPRVSVGGRDELRLTALALDVPEGRTLLRTPDLCITRGERVLLTGPSGSGKSTLFRAIVGIWPFGSGRIDRPLGRQLFLPQRTYVPHGSLKRAVCYPLRGSEFSDEQLSGALNDVGLGHLTSELDRIDEWGRRLSGGEQQRLAIARTLLHQPHWLFLDEATASLDPQAEEHLYELLRERLPTTTIVSIMHRHIMSASYNRVLKIKNNIIISEDLVST